MKDINLNELLGNQYLFCPLTALRVATLGQLLGCCECFETITKIKFQPNGRIVQLTRGGFAATQPATLGRARI